MSSAPSTPREQEERAVCAVPVAAAPTERGERDGHAVSVAATPSERRERAVFAPSTSPPRRRSSPLPPAPVKRRDPGRGAVIDCY